MSTVRRVTDHLCNTSGFVGATELGPSIGLGRRQCLVIHQVSVDDVVENVKGWANKSSRGDVCCIDGDNRAPQAKGG